MADHLIPYVEFLGLPGSGKSYYSHKVAEKLRAEGYKIAEPSWELDHTCGKYSRALRKICMSWLFSLLNPIQTKRINRIISQCGYKGGEFKRMSRNLLYKAYKLSGEKSEVLFFDEGLAQMALSLVVGGDKHAKQVYFEIDNALSIRRKRILVRIDCSMDDALQNMAKREKHDSRVEKMSDVNERISFLNRYQEECDSFNNLSYTCKYSPDSDRVVSEIVNYLKTEL